MKIIKYFFALAIVVFLFANCKKETEDKTTEIPKTLQIAPENLQIAKLSIEGMTCEMGCAKTIEENLANHKGVQSAKVDFKKNLATVRFDNKITTVKELIATVESSADGETYKVVNEE